MGEKLRLQKPQNAGLPDQKPFVRRDSYGDGLMAGRDVLSELEGKELGDLLVIPSVALRDGAFLDDVTVDDLARALGCRVEVIEPLPRRVLRRIVELAS